MKHLAIAIATLVLAASQARADDSAFFGDLLGRKEAMLDDGLRAMTIIESVKDAPKDFDGRLLWATLKTEPRRRLVSAEWDLRADATLTRGQLAYMLARGLDLKGGVMMRLLRLAGKSYERYSLREVEDLGLLDPGALYGPVSGREVMGAIARATSPGDVRKATLADVVNGSDLPKPGTRFQTGVGVRTAVALGTINITAGPLTRAVYTGGEDKMPEISLEFGSLSGGLGGIEGIVVQTPDLVATIGGGAFRIETSDRGTVVECIRATAKVKDRSTGGCIALRPGQSTDGWLRTPFVVARDKAALGFLPPGSVAAEREDGLAIERAEANRSLDDQRRRPGREDLLRDRAQ